MNIQPLDQSAVVLAGSSAGIALEIACQIAEAGVPKLMLNGRDPAKAEAALATVRGRAPNCDVRFTAADVSRAADGKRLIDETHAAFGRVDVLVNSIGGVMNPRPFHELDPSDFPRLLNGHILSVLHTCHAVLPYMIAQGGGAIINLGSDAGKVPTPGEAIIGGCKAAVLMFSRTLAMENGRHGVRVNCILPSLVKDTPLYDKVMAEPFSKKLFEKAMRRQHLGTTTPRDIAPMVVLLASPAGANISGQGISINGGLSAALG